MITGLNEAANQNEDQLWKDGNKKRMVIAKLWVEAFHDNKKRWEQIHQLI